MQSSETFSVWPIVCMCVCETLEGAYNHYFPFADVMENLLL